MESLNQQKLRLLKDILRSLTCNSKSSSTESCCPETNELLEDLKTKVIILQKV